MVRRAVEKIHDMEFLSELVSRRHDEDHVGVIRKIKDLGGKWELTQVATCRDGPFSDRAPETLKRCGEGGL